MIQQIPLRRLAGLCLGLLALFSLTMPVGRAQTSPWSLQLLEANDQHLLLELTLSTYDQEWLTLGGETYQHLHLPEWGQWGQPGQPQLPMLTSLLGMPAPGQPHLAIVEADRQTVSNVRIAPAPTLTLTPAVIETYTPDPDVYASDMVYPGQPVAAAESGWLRDQPVFQLRWYPFQYNPQRQELQIYRRLQVRVTFPSGGPSVSAMDHAPVAPAFETILRDSLFNYKSLSRPPIAPPTPSDIGPAATGATYLIITHPDFYQAIQPLATYRASHGQTVAVVQTQDIYNQFSGGVKSAQAIKSFLEQAYATWSPRPVYVLLVGDASRDVDNSSSPDLLPAYYVETPLEGLAPDDAWYAKVNGSDPYPDLIIGRISVRTTNEVATIINKIQTYEQTPLPGNWRSRAILVADDDDPNFQQDMNTAASYLPTAITPIKMYSYNPNTSVKNEVNIGALLLTYSGHGSATIWRTWAEGRNIFTQNQVQNLANGNKLPFMIVANCFNGFFSSSTVARSLGEEFLLIDNKGGIAAFAPSGYGFPTINSLIVEELYRALFVDENYILGSAVTTARVQAYLRRPDMPLILYEIFTYLGDPAVKLSLSTAPATLQLTGQDSPDPVTMGTLVTYALTYTVSGNPASGLTLVNTLPAQVTYQSASPSPLSVNGQTLTWNWGNFGPGSGAVTIIARVKTNGVAHGQTLTNQATLADVNSQRTIQLGTTAYDAPLAGLTASNNGPTPQGQSTTLTAGVTAGTNVVYTWNFGDGSPTQSGASVQHTYAAIGAYIAQVTAANGVSSQSQTTTVNVVETPPQASFFSSSPDKLGQTTTFQSTSSGTNLTYQWNFGDGIVSNLRQSLTISHTYPATGTYTVTMTATNSLDSSVATGAVTIVSSVGPPVADFISSSPDELGQTTRFANTSQDGGDKPTKVKYAWNLGDGAISTAQNPTHTYATLGMYQVALTITNSIGSATFSADVVITDVAVAGLVVENDGPTTLGSPTALWAKIITGTNVIYTWDFGDASSPATGAAVQHIYPAAGNYVATITAANGVSSQSQSTLVSVEAPPLGEEPAKTIFLPLILKGG